MQQRELGGTQAVSAAVYQAEAGSQPTRESARPGLEEQFGEGR